jgi:hypothetical protein
MTRLPLFFPPPLQLKALLPEAVALALVDLPLPISRRSLQAAPDLLDTSRRNVVPKTWTSSLVMRQ